MFCLVSLLLFLRSGCRRRRGILKVPNIRGLSPTFKPLFQQVSWVNTEFWLDNFTRESLHTRDIRHLTILQTFAKGH